jgi:hypothetical protein
MPRICCIALVFLLLSKGAFAKGFDEAELVTLQVYTRVFSYVARTYGVHSILVRDNPLLATDISRLEISSKRIRNLIEPETKRDWLQKASNPAPLALFTLKSRLERLKQINDPLNFDPYSLTFLEEQACFRESGKNGFDGTLSLSRVGCFGTEAIVRYRLEPRGQVPIEHFRVFEQRADSGGSKFMVEKNMSSREEH